MECFSLPSGKSQGSQPDACRWPERLTASAKMEDVSQRSFRHSLVESSKMEKPKLLPFVLTINKGLTQKGSPSKCVDLSLISRPMSKCWARGCAPWLDPRLGRQRQEEDLWGLLASQSILIGEFQVNERPSESWTVFLRDTIMAGLCLHMHPSHHTK